MKNIYPVFPSSKSWFPCILSEAPGHKFHTPLEKEEKKKKKQYWKNLILPAILK